MLPTRARRSPISVDYTLRPPSAEVGEPLTLVIQFASATEKGPMEVYYHSDNPEGLALGPGQPLSEQFEPDSRGHYPVRNVVLIPKQAGRHYIQVSVALHTQGGVKMRPVRIPIQVGLDIKNTVQPKEAATLERGISLPARME